jgi:hypothetical protein
MKPEELKARSRGVSQDMSPEAISARLDILADLYSTAKALASARFISKQQAGPGRSTGAEASPGRSRGR